MVAKSASIIVAAFAATAATLASAQFGLSMQLPEDDFIWTWGSDDRRGFTDFSVVGLESRFRCELTGKLRITSSLDRTETRQLEQQLRASMQFVYEATYTMNQFESYGYLDWAMLDCRKAERDDSEDEVAEREAKARERAERRRERRRASDD